MAWINRHRLLIGATLSAAVASVTIWHLGQETVGFVLLYLSGEILFGIINRQNRPFNFADPEHPHPRVRIPPFDPN
jgi:hypothetical protein